MAQSLNRKIIQSTGIVMAAIVLSRALGFVRDWTVAHEIGANGTTDAYFAAFTLPDFLNYLVAGGSLSITFIPVFAKFRSENREGEAWHVFSTVMSFMGLVVIALVCLAELFAPQIIALISPGFTTAGKQEAVFLTRIMLPAQFCFYEGGILSAVQYAKGQFTVPSIAPIIYNLTIILAGFLFAPRIGITAFAVGALVGAAIGNFLLQIYGATRAQAKFKFTLNLRHPGFRLFIKLAIPIMLALSLSFTDQWIIRWFASYLQSASISWLEFSQKLMRVPLGVVGQAIGVASFPFLAQLYSEGKLGELNRLLNDALKGLMLLLIPIAALTIAESRYVVHVAFSHTGRLHEADLHAIAVTLALFSLGMFAWGAQNLLARGFYSTRNTWTPAILGTAMTFADIPLYWWLSRRAQYSGLALASSIGITVLMIILFAVLVRHTRNSQVGELLRFFVKVAFAAMVAGVAVYEFAHWLAQYVMWQRALGSLEILVAATCVGLVLIFVLLKGLRVRELDAYLSRLRAWI